MGFILFTSSTVPSRVIKQHESFRWRLIKPHLDIHTEDQRSTPPFWGKLGLYERTRTFTLLFGAVLLLHGHQG